MFHLGKYVRMNLNLAQRRNGIGIVYASECEDIKLHSSDVVKAMRRGRKEGKRNEKG